MRMFPIFFFQISNSLSELWRKLHQTILINKLIEMTQPTSLYDAIFTVFRDTIVKRS